MVWSKRATGMRLIVYVDRKCKQQRTSACSPATSKEREDKQDNFKEAEDANPANCGLRGLGEHLRGWARWSWRIDYDARSFLSFLVYASAAWLALTAPSGPPRSAIRSTLWKSAYLSRRAARQTDIIWSVETPLICARRPQIRMMVGRYQPALPALVQTVGSRAHRDRPRSQARCSLPVPLLLRLVLEF